LPSRHKTVQLWRFELNLTTDNLDRTKLTNS
jgi:hypothetical protein